MCQLYSLNISSMSQKSYFEILLMCVTTIQFKVRQEFTKKNTNNKTKQKTHLKKPCSFLFRHRCDFEIRSTVIKSGKNGQRSVDMTIIQFKTPRLNTVQIKADNEFFCKQTCTLPASLKNPTKVIKRIIKTFYNLNMCTQFSLCTFNNHTNLNYLRKKLLIHR